MNELRARIQVHQDHSVSGVVPDYVPPGVHEVIISVTPPARKRLLLDGFPTHDLPWDPSISLRREDLYGPDGG